MTVWESIALHTTRQVPNYVHHQPRREAAERLGRHFTGAASELDALPGAPGDVQFGPPD